MKLHSLTRKETRRVQYLRPVRVVKNDDGDRYEQTTLDTPPGVDAEPMKEDVSACVGIWLAVLFILAVGCAGVAAMMAAGVQ